MLSGGLRLPTSLYRSRHPRKLCNMDPMCTTAVVTMRIRQMRGGNKVHDIPSVQLR